MRRFAPLSVALAFVWLCGCSKENEKETTPIIPVQLTEVRRASIQRIIEADGILRGVNQSSVTPKVSAPVAKFYVNRGAHVREGQLLATLENRDLAASVTDAKGAYAQADANYRNVVSATVPDELVKARADLDSGKEQLDAAKRLLDSREQLYKQGALARRLVDEAAVAYAQARSQYDTARKHLNSIESFSRQEEVKGAAGQLESARGKYDAARAQLSYSEIRSPLSGVIADRPLFPGEMATAGAPLLTVVDVSSVIARVNIPQEQAAYIKVGQPARIVSSGGSAEADGKVTVVSPAIDPQSTTVEIWIQALNPGERLCAGGTVHVTIFAGAIPEALVVPVPALLPGESGGTILMMVGPDYIAHQRAVKAGIRNKNMVQILSGAEPGWKVVSSGGVGLKDGNKVIIQKPVAEGAEHE